MKNRLLTLASHRFSSQDVLRSPFATPTNCMDPKQCAIASHRPRVQPTISTPSQPIFNRRCLVCHACYDAPCQLKMENFAGPRPGRQPGAGLRRCAVVGSAADASGHRCANDRSSGARKASIPVLNERDQTPQNNLNASVLYNMLALKAHNPLPERRSCRPDCSTSRLGRAQSCTHARSDAEVREGPSAMGHAVRAAGADVGPDAHASRSGCRPVRRRAAACPACRTRTSAR